MNSPLISIIVPIYNVEDYLDECVGSIVRQTYKNLEIILVDDGSTDFSGQKCDLWEKKDTRIRVIHKSNGGLSDARNVGLLVAKGSLIGFVDSDDVIHMQMYQRLYEVMSETGSEISCCHIKEAEAFHDFSSEPILEEQLQTYDAEQALYSIIKENDVFVMVWNKLYQKDVIRNILFEKGKCHEDEFWSYRIIANAKKISTTTGIFYGYRKRENSIMNQTYSIQKLDLLEAREQRLLFFQERFPRLLLLAKCDFRFECIRAMQFSLLYMKGEMWKVCKNRILQMVKKHRLTYREYRILPFGRQVWCWGSNRNFIGTCKLRNRLHYGP